MAYKLWFIISHHPHHRFTKTVATDKHFLIEKALLRLFWTHGNSGTVMNLTGPRNLCALSPSPALCIPSIWLLPSYTFIGQTSDLINSDIPHFILLHFIVLFFLFSRLLFLILWLYPSVQYLLFQCFSLLMVLTFYFTWNIAVVRLRRVRTLDIDCLSHGPAILFLRTFLQRSSYLLALRPCLLELANELQVRHVLL